ncbi:MAG: hypothetical protein ACPGQL_06215 [Thermoplasmatota archaeon]
MAKRNKPDEPEEGEYEFIPPDFDEDEFIHKEMTSVRTTLTLFGWGIVAAVASWALFTAMDGAKTAWYAGLAICAAAGYALKFIFPKVGADISKFGRREWFGTGFLFFFSWLAVFILLVNPPVSDFSPPQVEVLVSPGEQQAGDDIRLDVFATDNDALADITITVFQGNDATPLLETEDFTKVSGRHYTATFTAEPWTYRWVVEATDAKGLVTEKNGTFRGRIQALAYFPPDGDLLDAPQDSLLVQTPDGIKFRTVYLERTDALDRRIELEFVDEDGLTGWIARSNFFGWSSGENHFVIKAQEQNSFVGTTRVDGGTIVHDCGGTCLVNVTAPLGEYTPRVADPIMEPPERFTPGPAPVLVALALLAVAAFVRRRRD